MMFLREMLSFLILFSGIQFCGSFFLGGDKGDSNQARGSTGGFQKNPQVYSHLIIPPWNRPFKPGYCLSWEWHTDKKYRDKRIEICKQLTEGKHECDSPTGFCEDKCPYTNGSFPYWRLRNAAEVPFLWVISSAQMFDSPHSHTPLNINPVKAYSSSYFGPGYTPSNAFDNNPETLWVSNGASGPGMQWIAYEFDYPVSIGSIRLAAEFDKPERAPSLIYVEGSCEKYFRRFSTQWIIRNPKHLADKRSHAFRSATFNNLGATGSKGPTSVGNYYEGEDHDGAVEVNHGVQKWKVPVSGYFHIEAAGASGGYDKFKGSSKYRGKGNKVKGVFSLKKGDTIKILVGQEGTTNTVSGGGGGGGGTFVVGQDDSPLIIAGGGGGVDKMTRTYSSCHGSHTQNGNKGFGGSELNGGKNGQGAVEGDGGNSGGAGGGLLSSGRSGKNFKGKIGTGGQGGKSFKLGGQGGEALMNSIYGGFGGGGGAHGGNGGGGGGGGYSGGASGSKTGSCGGGGGSYNAGKDQVMKGGLNVGHGYVSIDFLGTKEK